MYTIYENPKKEYIQILNNMFGEYCCNNIEGVSLIYHQDTLIGFFQIMPFNEKDFVDEHELHDYRLSALKKENSLRLKNFYLREDFTGKGIGSSVVSDIKAKYNYSSLILYSVAEAEEFWEKQGFQECDTYVYEYMKP